MGNHKGISILLCSYLFLIELLSCSIHMHVTQSIFLFLSLPVLTFPCSWLGAAPGWGLQHHRLLLVGEFGVFAAVPLADRLSVSWLRKLSQG